MSWLSSASRRRFQAQVTTRREAFSKVEVAVVMAPDSEVAVPFPKGELRLDTPPGGKEGMLSGALASTLPPERTRSSHMPMAIA
jgi:hypothetical protein